MSPKEEALKANVRRLSDLLGADHLSVADAWVTLGLYLMEAGKSDEAEGSFRKALTIRLRALDETDETVTQLFYYIGRTYFERGDFAAAKRSYDSCLDIYESECRPEDNFLAAVLDALACLHHDRDQYSQAEGYLKRSLFIRLCVLEPFDSQIAESLNHLGWLYSQHGHYRKAESLFLSALDIWISNYGLGHASTAICLENYAEVLRKTGRDKEASQLLSKVDSIRSLKGSGL